MAAVVENNNPNIIINNNNNNNNNAAPAAIAVAPADQPINQANISNNNVVSGGGIENRNPQQQPIRSNNLHFQFRNDLYDRANNSPAYDVPRSVRSGLGMRRSNLQLDLNAVNRLRYGNNGKSAGIIGLNSFRDNNTNMMYRQRSFDDTESHHYYNLNYGSNAAMRYENIYEQIRDEPIYRNTTVNETSSSARLYGRLNVIGHGIGRIERHLSSSCGNIDHYNLGGHYAVLGHSHFGTVGHIRLNTAGNTVNNNGFSNNPGINANANSQKDNGVKTSTSSFFSCLGGENSQSMNNIYRATSANNNSSTSTTNSYLSSSVNSSRMNTPNLSIGSGISRNTGAIPKTKLGKISNLNSSNNSTSSAQSTLKTSGKPAQSTQQNPVQNPEHSSTLNRISKSSLQWLLVNKWLPLWVGQGPDCKVIDFNFMFSRNCDGCEYNSAQRCLSNTNAVQQQDVIKFNGRSSDVGVGNSNTARRGPLHSIRPLPNNLSRLRESEYGMNSLRRNVEENNYENVHVHFHNGFEFGKSRENYDYVKPPMLRARSESPTFSQRMYGKHIRKNVGYSDPFKNYELNAENNTFKPQKKEPNTNKSDKFKVNEGASTSSIGLLSTTKKESKTKFNPGESKTKCSRISIGNGNSSIDEKIIFSNNSNIQNNSDIIELKSNIRDENCDDKNIYNLNTKEAVADSDLTTTTSATTPEFTYNEDYDEDSDTYDDFESLKDGSNGLVAGNNAYNEDKAKNEKNSTTKTRESKDETENNDAIDENE